MWLYQALPKGFYSGSGMEKYVRTVLSDPDRTDDFRMLERELYLAATDLDTKGVAFEQFMDGFFKGDFGQYFTPRNVIAFASTAAVAAD